MLQRYSLRGGVEERWVFEAVAITIIVYVHAYN